MRSISPWIAAVAVCAMCTAPAIAQDSGTLKKIKGKNAITLGVRAAASPFSFLDDKQQYVGYSIDLCMKIVEAVKARLQMPDLKINLTKVTPQTRLPMVISGDVDLECGSSTNTVERQKTVAFVVTTFFTSTKLLVKSFAGLRSYRDLGGKTVVVTSGTTNEHAIKDYNLRESLGMRFIQVRDQQAAILAVDNGSAAAFPMDEVLLYGMRANAKNSADFAIVGEALTDEPYGIVLRKDDPPFKTLADDAVIVLFRSGEINRIYARWFESPIPPRNINLNMPMSSTLRSYISRPNSEGVGKCGRMQCMSP